MPVYPFDPIPSLLKLLVLLALRDGPCHGYQIESLVINSSQARFRLSNGSTYKTLSRLCQDRFVIPLEEKGPRGQVYYRLTPEGKSFLAREMNVLRYILRLYDHRPYDYHKKHE